MFKEVLATIHFFCNLCQRPETAVVYDLGVLIRKLLIKLLRFR